MADLRARRVFNGELMSADSQNLLREYVTNGSEAAFRELVQRYLNLVYSTALRSVNGDVALAQDIAQTVFVDLARLAQTLPRAVMLGGWLHRHTCFVASKTLRGERRRQSREREAAAMNHLYQSEPQFEQFAPLLDEAVNQLGTQDRLAIVLRFFEQRDLRAVGLALGSSENAAQKRVSRALESLRVLLQRRGVALSTVALGSVLVAEAVSAAPAGLALSISATALTTATTGTGTTLGLLKLATMTKLKAGILGALLVAGVAAPVALQQHRMQARLRQENAALRAQADRVWPLASDNERLSNLVTQATAARTENHLDELLKLRGEVAALRSREGELSRLKQENQRLKASRPSEAASELTPEQEKAATIAKMDDVKQMVLAMRMFANDNQDQLPGTLEQAMTNYGGNLTRTNEFELVYRGAVGALTNPDSTILVRETQAHQALSGNWIKTYGFADGHVEVHTEPDGNFEPWERQHMIAPPTAPPQGQ